MILSGQVSSPEGGSTETVTLSGNGDFIYTCYTSPNGVVMKENNNSYTDILKDSLVSIYFKPLYKYVSSTNLELLCTERNFYCFKITGNAIITLEPN